MKQAATAFFKQAIDNSGLPSKVVIDKSGANNAGLENINILLFLAGLYCFIDILQVKYLNNLVEQDHRFIKISFNERPVKCSHILTVRRIRNHP